MLNGPHSKFLSTLSLRRATTQDPQTYHQYQISIHALLAESDRFGPAGSYSSEYFYPRSPCGERLILTALLIQPTRFLSTLSLRRATSKIPLHCCPIINFYPRSPCGERPMMQSMVVILTLFLSTLSLRRATTTTITICIVLKFLSTLSLRRATHYDNYNLHCVEISIHALLAESDPRGGFCYLDNIISIHALLAESD